VNDTIDKPTTTGEHPATVETDPTRALATEVLSVMLTSPEFKAILARLTAKAETPASPPAAPATPTFAKPAPEHPGRGIAGHKVDCACIPCRSKRGEKVPARHKATPPAAKVAIFPKPAPRPAPKRERLSVTRTVYLSPQMSMRLADLARVRGVKTNRVIRSLLSLALRLTVEQATPGPKRGRVALPLAGDVR
jgi:hypothetical protein